MQGRSPSDDGQLVARSDTADDGGSRLSKKTPLTDPGPLRGRRATSPAGGRGIMRQPSYQRRQTSTGSTPCSNLAPIGAPQPAAVPSCTRLVALEGSPGLRPCERRERRERERVRLVGQTPAGRGQGARPRGSRGILGRTGDRGSLLRPARRRLMGLGDKTATARRPELAGQPSARSVIPFVETVLKNSHSGRRPGAPPSPPSLRHSVPEVPFAQRLALPRSLINSARVSDA